jgi:phosphate transporter
VLQGGLVLSEAVKESGILAVAASGIEARTHGMGLWQIAAIFCALVLVCTTFVSHTVGAMVILPVVASVGEHMEHPHPQLLVLATALMCSCAMGLPVSGFPNMTAIALEDATGKTYVKVLDFIRVGLPSSAIGWVVVMTLGYALMVAIGY